MADNTLNLYLDVKEFDRLLRKYERELSEETYEKIIRGFASDMQRRAITPINRAIRTQYNVGVSEVISAFGTLKTVQEDSRLIKCWFNVRGVRKGIPNQAPGKRGPRRGNLYAKILKGGEEPLPKTGRRPHILIYNGAVRVVQGNKTYMGAEKKTLASGKVKVYRRRRPVTSRAVSLAIPQMPVNRAKPMVLEQIGELMVKRLTHQAQRHMPSFK